MILVRIGRCLRGIWGVSLGIAFWQAFSFAETPPVVPCLIPDNLCYEKLEAQYNFFFGQEKYSRALKQALKIRDLAQQAHDPKLIGNALVMAGHCYFRMSKLKQARNAYQRARKILGDDTIQAHIGNVYADSGRYDEAVQAYQKAFQAFRRLGDAVSQGRMQLNSAITQNRQGQPKQALIAARAALSFFQDDSVEAAKTHLTIGGIYEAFGFEQNANWYFQALTEYEVALRIYQHNGTRRDRGLAFNNVGKTLDRLGISLNAPASQRQAIARYHAAAECFRTITAETLLARTLNNLGEAYLHLSVAETPAAHLNTALTHLLAAQKLQRAANDPSRLWMTESNLGEVYEQQAHFRDALSAYQRAAETFEGIVDFASIEESKLSLREKIETTYLYLVGLLARAGRFEQAFAWTERARARVLLDQLGQQRQASAPPLTLTQAQQHLDRQTTLLAYVVVSDYVIAFVIRDDAFKGFLLPIEQATLTRLITATRQEPSAETTDQPWRELYARLIAPLQHELITPRLGIVPHDALHYLAFAALTDGRKYLGERRALFMLPSVSAFAMLPQPQAASDETVLAVANDQINGQPSLPAVFEEVRAIQNIFPTRLLTGAAASVAAVREAAQNCTILHLAAHGKLDAAQPRASRVYLSPNSILNVQEIATWQLPRTHLVVLSACETSLGKRWRGDDITGLTRAFLAAGASSVIASLWPVDDRATALLMKSFYAALRQGHGKAEALQTAQQTVRRRYPQPYDWAGFVLIGDPNALTPTGLADH